MAGSAPYSNTDSYSVSKQLPRGGVSIGIPLVFKDPAGNVLLTAKQGGIGGRHALLVDGQGNEVGSIGKKGIQLGNKATYQFFQGSTMIGQITINSSMMGMSETIAMQDPNGNPVASASGNFMGFNFEVTDPEGKKTLAKIYRDTQKQQSQGGGLKGMLMNVASAAASMVMGAYKIDITDRSINDLSRLYILELVVVLDEMYQPQQRMGPGGFGVGGSMGGIKF